MNIDHAVAGERPDERDAYFRLAASILILAIDDACDQAPMKKRGDPWRSDEQRIEQIIEALRRRAGYGPEEEVKPSLKAATVEAIAWLFDDAMHPLSARGIADAMGADLDRIRREVKHRPAAFRRALVRERMGLRKMFPRRESEQEAA